MLGLASETVQMSQSVRENSLSPILTTVETSTAARVPNCFLLQREDLQKPIKAGSLGNCKGRKGAHER